MQWFVDWLLDVSPKLIPSLLHVFVILALGLITLRLVDSALKRFARIVPSDEAHRDRINHRTETLRHFVRSAGRAVLLILAFATVASDTGVLPVLSPFLGATAIAGLAIGFGAQTLVKDLIAGFFVLFEDQYGVGETIRVGTLEGVVEAMTLRVTILRSAEGEVHVIPNGSIQTVTVLSRDWRRAVVDVEVSSREDLARVLSVLTRIGGSLATEMHGRVIESPSIVGIQRITGASVSIRLAAKTLPSEQGAVTHEWRRRIKETFDKEGIRLSEGPAAMLPSPSAGS